MSSSTDPITSIPHISVAITELSAFFYQSRSQEIALIHTGYQNELSKIRESVIMQGLAFNQTVVTATREAEGGQIIAHRIVSLLKKIKTNPSKDVMEDLLESLQEKIQSQLERVEEVKSGFENVRSGLLTISGERDGINPKITSDQSNAREKAEKSAAAAKWYRNAAMWTSWTIIGGLIFGYLAKGQSRNEDAANLELQAATQAREILNVMCDGINDAVNILTQHVDFWSDFHARINAQLVEMTPEKLIKNNGKIRIGNVEQGEEEWGEFEAMYRQYASAARRSRQILNA